MMEEPNHRTSLRVGGGLENSMSGGQVIVVGVRSGIGCRILSGDISKGSRPVSAPSHNRTSGPRGQVGNSLWKTEGAARDPV